VIFLIRKSLTSGHHLSDAARRAGPMRQRAVATSLPCAAPSPWLKAAVGTARRASRQSASRVPPSPRQRPHARPTASPRSSRPRRRPVRSRPSLSERHDHRCLAASAVASTTTVSVARALLSQFLVRGASSSPSPPSSLSPDRCG
jgi:hypothetical protein